MCRTFSFSWRFAGENQGVIHCVIHGWKIGVAATVTILRSLSFMSKRLVILRCFLFYSATRIIDAASEVRDQSKGLGAHLGLG